MNEAINLYGDRLSPSGPYGSNISEQRIDELDRACLDFVKTRMELSGLCQAVDIGGGSGAQSKRLAELGASILMVDLTDQRQVINSFNVGLGREAICFIQRDARKISANEWPSSINCIYSQRMLGCIPYPDMLRLIQILKRKAAPQAHFFLSTGGLEAEYGQDYLDRDKPVEERFALLSPDMAAKHAIFAPECLYRESELRQLAEKADLVVVRSWTSPFGNPKLIARA